MSREWIENEGGISQAAAKIAPAVRMAFRKGGVICFVKNPDLQAHGFEEICLTVGLYGVYSGDQSETDIESIYADVTGYGENSDADEIELLGVENLGCFCLADDKQSADAMARAIMEGNAWKELEKEVGKSGYQRLAGKIAIVTGSAQGFGDGVAREMVANGAYMIIADLNEELAQKNAADINAQYGAGKALAIKVDVSNEESVSAMIDQCILAYGGLDIMVSNAGVLKAGGLEEMSLEDFAFVTRINYSAFFVCCKYAARVMKLQHRFDPNYKADIIQINSKSGLTGSNKNFAYAGSKFGGIGLVQSFAKELVGEGIKVNAICPGNFYEGPLWSDPERGLFVQYLKAGKVPGAQNLDDVKKFYVDQVPMRRGCYPRDVARAIYYCVEQEYETGQAIPVTGGQTMLK